MPFLRYQFRGPGGTGGGRFAEAGALAGAIEATWPGSTRARFVVFTGGEPLLQLDTALLDAVHGRGFQTAVETNGTLPAPPGLDWICVSPKAGTTLRLRSGSELKLVFPQAGLNPADLEMLEFPHF